MHFNLQVKLDNNNYIQWKAQVFLVIKAFQLEDYVLNDKPIPPKHLEASSTSEGNQNQNTHSQFTHSQLNGNNMPLAGNNTAALTNAPHQANYHQSTAFYATPETVCDPAWYADSGATNNVTSYVSNLSLHSEYQGNDRLAVGKTFISSHNNSSSCCY